MNKNVDKRIIPDFKAVDFMRNEREKINREIQGMNYYELIQYFKERKSIEQQNNHKKN